MNNSFIKLESIIKSNLEEKKLQPSSSIKIESKIEDKRFINLKHRFIKMTLSDVIAYFKSSLDNKEIQKIKTKNGRSGYSITIYYNHEEKHEVIANLIDGEIGIEAIILFFDNDKKLFDFIKL